ncbi:MAG: hypothetical protein Q4C47_09795, partial [Planctomycetia bacterium]|nr:hypothetical protein [Planctomycetia bacterium]
SEPVPDRWTELELIEKEMVTEETNRLAAALKSRLESLGPPPEPETVMTAVQRWCHDDLTRSLQSADPSVLHTAFQKFGDLSTIWTENYNDRSSILTEDHNDLSSISTDDHNDQHTISTRTLYPIDWSRNPFVNHPLRAVERDYGDPSVTSEECPRLFPVGRPGFEAIREPWDFRRYAEESAVLVWSLTREGSPLRNRPEYVEPLLSRLQLLATQHLHGDYGAGRSSPRGYDPNGNRFALAAALEAWRTWTVAYPESLPPTWYREIDEGFRRMVTFQVEEYGTGRIDQITGKSFDTLTEKELISVGYANMDAVYLRILDLAIRHWPGDPAQGRWRSERTVFQRILASSLLPDGGFRYLADENDSPLYHQVVVLHLAAIVRDGRAESPGGEIPEAGILRGSLPYYPLTFEPSGMAEYTTSPAWKRYWNRGDAAAPAIIAGLCNDPANQAVAETCARVWGYGKGYYAITAADFWRPIVPEDSAKRRVVPDMNIGGLRGRCGRWSWVAGGRVPETESGNETVTFRVNGERSEAEVTYVFR